MPDAAAGPLGATSFRQHAARTRQAEIGGDLGGDLLASRAQPGAANRRAGRGGLQHRAHQGGRNREADPDRAARLREDGGVDADQLAVEIDERAARIARIDRRVGLDEGRDVAADTGAGERRHDAAGHGLADTEGIADREHQIADFEPIAVADFQHRQLLALGIDLEHGQIGALVGDDNLGIELAAVVQDDGDLLGALDDVPIGHDQAVTIEDDARAERLLHALARQAELRLIAKKAAEYRIVEKRRPGLDDPAGIDVDDRGRHSLHHRREGEVNERGARGRRRFLRMRGRQRQEEQRESDSRNAHRHAGHFKRDAGPAPVSRKIAIVAGSPRVL